MSWRTRFRAQQYVKNSLWLAPFLDMTPSNSLIAQGAARRGWI